MATEQVSGLLTNATFHVNSSFSTLVHPHDSLIWIVAAPLLIIIGCAENILALIVLSRSQFGNLPSRITLISLALIDSLVLFFGLIRFWINVVFKTQPAEWGDGWCKFISWIVISLSHLSSCLVALLSVERLFAVCLPHRQLKPSVDLGGSLILIILCCTINTIHFKLTHLVSNLPPTSENVTLPEPGIHTQLHAYICTNRTTEIALFVDILDILFLFGLPFLTIVLCNFYIIFKLRKRLQIAKQNRYLSIRYDYEQINEEKKKKGEEEEEKKKKKNKKTIKKKKKSIISVHLTQPRPDHRTDYQNSTSLTIIQEPLDKSNENPIRRKLDKSYSERRQTRITITLLIVTFTFLVCNLPFSIVHILRTADENRQTPVWNMIWLLSYLLVYANNCINFPIYIISQPPFRSELKRILSFYKR